MILGAIEGLSAWWLMAGVAASAPVVAAHLFGRRGRRLVFPPASLLLNMTSSGGAGDRIRKILRLALRVASLILIAAAFSGPVWRTVGAEAVNADGRDLLIVIDRSASMERTHRGASIFDRAIAEALILLDEVDPARDRAAVLAVGATADALLPEWSANVAALRERVGAMRPALERGDAAGAMRREAEFVERSHREGRAARVVVITDGQASQWAAAPGEIAGERVEWIDLRAAAEQTNIAVTGFVTPEDAIHAREPVRIGVRVARFGSGRTGAERAGVPVTLDVGGTMQTRTVAPEPGIEETVWFEMVAPEAGTVRLRAEIPADALGADNSAELTLPVRDRPAVTLVLPQRGTAYTDSLIAAVEAASGSPPGVVGAEDFAPSVGDTLVVAGAMESSAIDRLRAHLDEGGTFVWIVDSPAAAESLADAAARGIVPIPPDVDWRDGGAERIDAASARAFFGVGDGESAAAIDAIARDTHVSSRAIVRASAPVAVLSLANGDPLAIVLRAGASRVTIIAVDPSPSASNIARSAVWPMLLDVAPRGLAPTPTRASALDPRESDLAHLEHARGGDAGAQRIAGGESAPYRQLVFELTPVLLLVVLAIAVGDLLFFGTRGGTGWWISLAGAGLIAVAVADPRRATDAADGAERSLVILLDASESMGVADAGAGGVARRIDAVRAEYLDSAALARLEESGVALRALTLDRASGSDSLDALRAAEPIGARTPLVSSIERAIAAAGVNGRVLVLTDGAETERHADTALLADRAITRGVRVDAVVVGSDLAIGVPRVVAHATPGVVFAGERAAIVAEIVGGDPAGVARVELYVGDSSGRLSDSREYPSGAGGAEYVFDVTPSGAGAESPGWTGYTVALVADDGSSSRTLATRRVFIETLEQPARVLVLEGQPGWQSAFFVEALRDEPRVDVTSVSAVTSGRVLVRRISATGVLEGYEAGYSPIFDGFDLVVLGRGVGRWFDDDAAAALERFVLDGGALLFLRGDPAGGDPAVSAAWRRVVGAIMPSASDSVDPSLERALGGDAGVAAPTFAVRRVGLGRIAAVADQELWRRALAGPDARTAFGEHWSRAARWLALGGAFTPGVFARIEFDDGPRAPGEVISATLRVRSDVASARASVRAVVRDPEGRETPAVVEAMGLERSGWRVRFTPSREGTHTLRAEAGGLLVSAPIEVQEDRRERFDVAARPGWLRELSAATGGRLWADGDAGGFVGDAIAWRNDLGRIADSEGAGETEPIWDSAWFFALVAGTLVAGWLVRREGA